jgi:hypothetical protein
MQTSAKPKQHTAPCLWRLPVAATVVGLTPYLFEVGCRDGSIPVRVQHIGPQRVRFVDRAEIEAWLGRTF